MHTCSTVSTVSIVSLYKQHCQSLQIALSAFTDSLYRQRCHPLQVALSDCTVSSVSLCNQLRQPVLSALSALQSALSALQSALSALQSALSAYSQLCQQVQSSLLAFTVSSVSLYSQQAGSRPPDSDWWPAAPTSLSASKSMTSRRNVLPKWRGTQNNAVMDFHTHTPNPTKWNKIVALDNGFSNYKDGGIPST